MLCSQERKQFPESVVSHYNGKHIDPQKADIFYIVIQILALIGFKTKMYSTTDFGPALSAANYTAIPFSVNNSFCVRT